MKKSVIVVSIILTLVFWLSFNHTKVILAQVATPTPTAPPICTPFTDDFTATTLNSSNWTFFSNGLGTNAVGNGNVTVSLPTTTEVTAKQSQLAANKMLKGDFSAELTFVSRDATNTYEYMQYNTAANSINGFGIRLLNGSLNTEVYGAAVNPNNPGAQNHNVVIAKDKAFKIRLERVGNSVKMYYDLLDGQGYKLLRSFDTFTNTDAGYILFGVQHTGPVNLAISGTFDNYTQTCVAANVCGGIAGRICPTGFACRYKTSGTDVYVTPGSADMQGVCTAITGDLDGDGAINFRDYFYYVTVKSGGAVPGAIFADLNKDGKVDNLDLAYMLKSLLAILI